MEQEELKKRTGPPNITCKYCGYSWRRRCVEPAECSKCKARNFQAVM